MALRPDAQTLLMVVASADLGMPEARRTWRAGDWPVPAWMTCGFKQEKEGEGRRSNQSSEGGRGEGDMSAFNCIPAVWGFGRGSVKGDEGRGEGKDGGQRSDKPSSQSRHRVL